MGAVLEKNCAPVCQEIVTHHLGAVLHPDQEDIPDLPPDLRVFGEAKGTNNGSGHGHSQPVLWISIFASNTRALTASSDGTLKIWDLRTYTVRHTLSGGHGGAPVHCCTPFANATRAISGGADNSLRVWDLENTSLIGPPLQRHTAPVLVVAIGRASTPPAMPATTATSQQPSATVRGRNHLGLIPQQHRQPPSSSSSAVAAATQSRESKAPNTATVTTVFSGGADGLICVWGVPSAARSWSSDPSSNLVAATSAHDGPVRCLSVFGGGLRLLSGSADGTAKVWELSGDSSSPSSAASSSFSPLSMRCVATLRGHTAAVNCCSVFGTARENFATRASNGNGGGHSDSVRCKSCGVRVRMGSGDSDGGCGGDGDGAVEAIERHLQFDCQATTTATGATTKTAIGTNDDGDDVESDVLVALTGSADETLRVWDLRRGGEAAGVLLGHFESVTCCSLYAAHSLTRNASTPNLAPPPPPRLGWGGNWAQKPDETHVGEEETKKAIGDAGGDSSDRGGSRFALALSGSLDETLKVWEIPLPSSPNSPSSTLEEASRADTNDDDRENIQRSSTNENEGTRNGIGRLGGDGGGDDNGVAVLACRHTLSGHVAGVTSCTAFREDGGGKGGKGGGGMALSGSFDRTLKVWDIPDR